VQKSVCGLKFLRLFQVNANVCFRPIPAISEWPDKVRALPGVIPVTSIRSLPSRAGYRAGSEAPRPNEPQIGVGHIAPTVSDVATSTRFYGALGLQPCHEGGGIGIAILELRGGTRLLLFSREAGARFRSAQRNGGRHCCQPPLRRAKDLPVFVTWSAENPKAPIKPALDPGSPAQASLSI